MGLLCIYCSATCFFYLTIYTLDVCQIGSYDSFLFFLERWTPGMSPQRALSLCPKMRADGTCLRHALLEHSVSIWGAVCLPWGVSPLPALSLHCRRGADPLAFRLIESCLPVWKREVGICLFFSEPFLSVWKRRAPFGISPHKALALFLRERAGNLAFLLRVRSPCLRWRTSIHRAFLVRELYLSAWRSELVIPKKMAGSPAFLLLKPRARSLTEGELQPPAFLLRGFCFSAWGGGWTLWHFLSEGFLSIWKRSATQRLPSLSAVSVCKGGLSLQSVSP